MGPEIDAMAAVASAHEASRDSDVLHCGLVPHNKQLPDESRVGN